MLTLLSLAGFPKDWTALLLAATALGGCARSPAPQRNRLPAFLLRGANASATADSSLGPLHTMSYDGVTDDLLTAGLGKSGLANPTPPAVANAIAPTAAELRRLAIWNNYRALVDMTSGGGFGVLYGPNVDVNGNTTSSEGKIAGEETLAYVDDGTGRVNVTLMVQVPATFDKAHPCIITATSSGSRGVYGAIATAGEWGLKHGCAVAYTDKGTGTGAHDLQADTVGLIDGTRVSAADAGTASSFTANLTDAERAAFDAATPFRFAFKHAHSQQNPEKDWGRNTLQAIELAFFLLNEKFGDRDDDGVHHLRTLAPGKVPVIASSVSNGAGAALAAAEQDDEGVISGLVAAEPQAQIEPVEGLVVQRGGAPVASGKTLLDYTTIANLYQPCAALSPAAAAPGMGAGFVNATLAKNRCAALQQKGLLTSATPSGQADEALQRLRQAGWEPESNAVHASHYALATTAIAVTYANAYARASVKDNLCGFSFAATDAAGSPAPLPVVVAAQLFGTSNGIPPTAGINLINNDSVNGPRRDPVSVSGSTGQQDFNVDGAVCLRKLAAGQDRDGSSLSRADAATAEAVQEGISEVLRSGDLHGKPAILVQGRSDTLVPVNHASRAYFGLNHLVEGARSRLVYYEVTNAQHFDSFIGLTSVLPGYQTRFVPLHRYFIQAMDLMFAAVTSGAPLPSSQVVRTVPRGGAPGSAPAITPANVPAIAPSPAPADAISFSAGTVNVPD